MPDDLAALLRPQRLTEVVDIGANPIDLTLRCIVMLEQGGHLAAGSQNAYLESLARTIQ